MPEKIVIWGTGGHALVVANIIQMNGAFELVGFLDDINLERHQSLFCGLPVLGGKEKIEQLLHAGVENMIVGFGDCRKRLELYEALCCKGFHFPSAIHPQSIIAADVPVGPGSVVVAGAVINPGSSIGGGVIINTSASVDHECIIDDGAHICPGVHLAGNVHIGRAAWVGIGSTVLDRVSIGDNAYIGAGSIVLSDIPANVVAFGAPAKVVKSNE